MSGNVTGALGQVDLRMRAMERLRPEAGAPASRRSASEALSVLFDMASKPSTAGSALAVLHELQVHQVELELQDEELAPFPCRAGRALRRQMQLYDHSPVGYFTVDQNGALHELNLAGAAMIGCVRDQLLGRTLLTFLEPRSAADPTGDACETERRRPFRIGHAPVAGGRVIPLCVPPPSAILMVGVSFWPSLMPPNPGKSGRPTCPSAPAGQA